MLQCRGCALLQQSFVAHALCMLSDCCHNSWLLTQGLSCWTTCCRNVWSAGTMLILNTPPWPDVVTLLHIKSSPLPCWKGTTLCFYMLENLHTLQWWMLIKDVVSICWVYACWSESTLFPTLLDAVASHSSSSFSISVALGCWAREVAVSPTCWSSFGSTLCLLLHVVIISCWWMVLV